MTRDEILADLREQSKADRRVKSDGHNRRPVARSLKRLRRRRHRRRGRVTFRNHARLPQSAAACTRRATQRRDRRWVSVPGLSNRDYRPRGSAARLGKRIVLGR